MRESYSNIIIINTYSLTHSLTHSTLSYLSFTNPTAYNNGIMFLDLEGSPLPYEMRHRHPLLSTSLAEFWGSRWNPIIGKLLQEAFYKPVRRLDFSRVTAMLACFSGSAILVSLYIHSAINYLIASSHSHIHKHSILN